MKVITRFAPSPTGDLHIGSARTALFNFLYAKHYGGKFFLRVEDTDKKRSTTEATQGILQGLKWLNINYDGDIIFQSNNIRRHQEIAEKLVEIGRAYYCLTPLVEVQAKREEAQQKKQSYIFKSEWRDRKLTKRDIPAGANAVIRLRAPQDGTTTIDDLVQGKVTVHNDHLDDMILLRSDGSPTYMLAVVVDDNDMGVTHIIRGDDHLNNAFRQLHIYQALEWQIPQYAHIPLIHAEDGTKLSKRHGAMGVKEYEKKGYLPEALNNYLLRLGWSHGNDEIISINDAIKWFDVKDVNKAAARMDYNKMLHLNGHYLQHTDNQYLINYMESFLEKKLTDEKKQILNKGLNGLKSRAKTIVELVKYAEFYLYDEPIDITDEAKDIIKGSDKALFRKLQSILKSIDSWTESEIKNVLKKFLKDHDIKLGEIGPVLRAALTGNINAPSIFEVMYALGKAKAVLRIQQSFA